MDLGRRHAVLHAHCQPRAEWKVWLCTVLRAYWAAKFWKIALGDVASEAAGGRARVLCDTIGVRATSAMPREQTVKHRSQ